MKRLLPILLLLSAGALTGLAEEPLVRNPFWAQGYEGTRHPITIVPRVKPEPPKPETNVVTVVEKKPPAQSAEEKAAAEAAAEEKRLWSEAVKGLSFGSTFSFSDKNGVKMSIVINDRVYTVGDLISAENEDIRFTWRIESLSTDGKLKLKPLIHNPIRKNP